MDEYLADGAEGVAEGLVAEEVGGVFCPDNDGVDVVGADLAEAAGEAVGVVADELGAPGGADDPVASSSWAGGCCHEVVGVFRD